MTDATLNQFRAIAETMIPDANWQWIGPHMSQRMFGITKERAQMYAARHGGEAKPMPTPEEIQAETDRIIAKFQNR